MSDATCAGGFVPPDLTSFCRLDGLGLVVTGQRISAGRAVLACRVVGGGADGWCGECGCKAVVRDSVVRRLAHEPLGGGRPPWSSVCAGTAATAAGGCGART
jgi:hypothetical protein